MPKRRRRGKTVDATLPPTHRPPLPAPAPQLSPCCGDNVHTTPSASPKSVSAAGSDAEKFVTDTQVNNIRPVLTLDGEGFLPSHDAAKAITSLFRKYYTAPWPSWTKIPKAMRKNWFDEFMGQFSVFPVDESLAHRNFERRGAVLLKNNLEKVRTKMKRPHWIGEEVWDGLCRHWQSERFRKASSVAKANRASERRGYVGPTHAGGSISTSQHRLNMTKELGVAPALIEVFRRTHQRRDQTWVNQKAEQLVERFNREMNQQSQSASDIRDPPNELDVWRNVAGSNKGRIYGLGSESPILYPRPQHLGSSCASTQRVRDFEEIRTTQNQLLDKLASTQSELTNTQKELADTKEKLDKTNQMLQQVMQFLKFNPVNFSAESSTRQEDRQKAHIYDDADDDDEDEI